MNKQSPVLMICVTVLGIATLVSVVALVALAPADSDLPTLMASLLTPAVTLVGLLAALGKLEQTKSLAEHTKATTDDLANGKMDAKIRAGVAEVLRNQLIDPTALDQIAADKVKRDS